MSGLALHRCRGPGPTVLWLHGYTMDSTVWDELWRRLPGWNHVGVDLPGHGQSAAMLMIGSLPEVARLVHEIAVQENAQHLVGISFGSMIALQTAFQFPARFRSLILGSTAIGGGAQDPVAQQRNVELIELYRVRGAGPWMTDLWWQSPPDIFRGAARQAALTAQLRAVIDRHSWRELAGDAMHGLCHHRHVAADFRKIRARTLIVLGDEDMPVFKRNAELVRGAVRDARRIYLPGAGHLCLLECPAESAALIEAHLAAADAAVATGGSSLSREAVGPVDVAPTL